MTTVSPADRADRRGAAWRLFAALMRVGVTGAATLALVLLFTVPMILMVAGSFRPNEEMFRFSGELSIFTFLPQHPTIAAYARLLERPLFFWQLGNTIVAGVVLASLATLLSLLAAYPLARWRLRGGQALFLVMLATTFIPLDIILTPLFFVVRDLRLIDNFWGLVLPFVFSPLSIYLVKQAIEEVPAELDHAAALDGAGPLEILRTAILPNIKPSLLAVWLMNFVFVWEWFLWPTIAMRRDSGQLAQVAITGLLNPLGVDDNALVFAGAVATTVPAFIVFILLQRFLVETIVSSGGK